MKKKQSLLLLEDVYGLGKKGQIAQAKPGYFRNFLLPKKQAVIADKHTLRMQERLKKEREERAKIDRQESEKTKEKLLALTLTVTVKTDPEGRMYGSVNTNEILSLLEKESISIEKHAIKLQKPIKTLGVHHIPLLLKEEVTASCKLIVDPEEKELKEALAKKAQEQEAAKDELPEDEDSNPNG